LILSLAIILAFPIGRRRVSILAAWSRVQVTRLISGMEPDRSVIDVEMAARRRDAEALSTRSLIQFYEQASPEIRHFFEVAGLAPGDGLVRCGRVDQAILFSSRVFDRDDHGRSYRLKPQVESVWVRQVTLRGGPFALLEVPDTPEVRAAVGAARGITDDRTRQRTNSWGLRGPEPDPNASVRGVVLGDSFMQGMFVGDSETPPFLLEQILSAAWKRSVCVLNTGHVGYAPEQYYHSLREYGDTLRPHFVVLSVCPNDFGDEVAVFRGEGEWGDEAAYWLEQIQAWCRARDVLCLLVPIPMIEQVESFRKDQNYPGLICDMFPNTPSRICNPLEAFLDEHLRLRKAAIENDQPYPGSLLYNSDVHDGHFSPRGAALWATVVGRRLESLIDPDQLLHP
jgi:hypothetical protein